MGLSNQKKDKPEPEHLAAAAVLSDEQLLLHRHRYREARRAGMNVTNAKLFASAPVDIEEMRALARQGCRPDLILRILL